MQPQKRTVDGVLMSMDRVCGDLTSKYVSLKLN